jgi:hypothetical protein
MTGQVVDPEGKGIANARINTMIRGPRWGSTIGSREPTMTDEEGKFEIRAIPADNKYNLYTRAEGYGENRGEEINTEDAVNNHLDVGTVTLAVANLSVSGMVVDDEDKPVAGAQVSCFGDNQPNRRTRTDTEGKFTLEKVCAGKIRISANKSGTPRLYGSIETEGGATDVQIVISQRSSSTRYQPKRPPSLVSRPLPKLNELGVDLSEADTDGKIMLVCFWDMEQRPSRNCIMRLVRQAQQLKQKGVTIVAVQASKIDENTLNEWLKKYNIPFTIGIVQGDVEKTKFTWGVKSLPWLILTNWEQTVIAEGFGIDELDEELKKNIDTEHAIQKNKATPTKPVAQTGLSDPAKSFLDAEAILAGWESNYAGIRTMRVSYCTRLIDYQPPANNPDIDMTGLVKYQHVERVEDGKRYHIRFSKAEDGFDRPESLMEHAFDGKITREYSAREKHGSIVAGLIGRNTETMNDLKVYMLLRRRLVGGRNASGTYLIEDPNSKPDLSRTLSYAISRSIVSMLPKLEPVAGQLCHVVEVVLPGKDHNGIPRQIKQVFWMAHNKGMCLMKYQWYWDNKLDREIEVEQIAMAKMDGTDVWYPKKAYRTLFNEEVGTMKYELTVKDFVPNVEVDENTFRFDFPKGTYVFDRVRGIAGADLPKEPGAEDFRLSELDAKISANTQK